MSRIHTPAMSRMQNFARNPVMIALVAGLALAGCANKKTPNSAGELGLGAGAATPGSAQDFTVNVGDRIFFDTDSTSIRADAAQTLDRQAQWLARYPNYAITVEGHADERGTREYKPRSRRPPCCRHQGLPCFARRSGSAHEDDLLRQGTPGRRLRRYFLLVAEPSCSHCSRRRRYVILSNILRCGKAAPSRAAFSF
ncbi:hypothetical protein ACVJBD_004699 [Rhizobium mongolense]